MAELAEELGVSRSSVWRWAQKGLLEVSRLGPHTGVRVRLRSETRSASTADARATQEVQAGRRVRQDRYGQVFDDDAVPSRRIPSR